MLPYWLLFSVFAAGALQYGRHASVGVRAAPMLSAAGLLIAVIVGLRFEVGGDWDNYIDILGEARFDDFLESVTKSDPGYELLNWLAQRLEVEIWFVNFVCALIFSFGLVEFARQQPNPWLVMVIALPYLIIVVAMGYTRQGVAIGLIMAALAAIERQALIRFAIYIAIAATFHKTAVVIIPLVALTAQRHRFVIGVLMAVMAYGLYGWFLEASVDRMVFNYIEQEYSSQGAAIRVAMNLPPAALFLLFAKRFRLSKEQLTLWRNFALAAFLMLVMLLLLASSTVVDRLALYIIPLQLFCLSRIPDAFPNRDGGRNSQLVILVRIYSALVQFVWLNYAKNADFWLPYQFYPFFESAGS